MAFDKVVDSAVLDAGLKQIADAIREKGGTSDSLAFPAAMAEAIAAIEAGGGGAEVSYGMMTPASNTTSLTWEHGLSKQPDFVMVWLPTGYSAGSYTNTLRAYYKQYGYADSVNEKYEAYVTGSKSAYMYHESKLSGNDVTWAITNTSVTAGECYFSYSTIASFIAGKPYCWICVAGDVVLPYE